MMAAMKAAVDDDAEKLAAMRQLCSQLRKKEIKAAQFLEKLTALAGGAKAVDTFFEDLMTLLQLGKRGVEMAETVAELRRLRPEPARDSSGSEWRETLSSIDLHHSLGAAPGERATAEAEAPSFEATDDPSAGGLEASGDLPPLRISSAATGAAPPVAAEEMAREGAEGGSDAALMPPPPTLDELEVQFRALAGAAPEREAVEQHVGDKLRGVSLADADLRAYVLREHPGHRISSAADVGWLKAARSGPAEGPTASRVKDEAFQKGRKKLGDRGEGWGASSAHRMMRFRRANAG